jgi:CHRD domain/PEP-CTERM motif
MNSLARALGAPVLGTLLLFGGAAQAVTLLTAQMTNDQETSSVVPTTTGGDPRPISFGNATLEINDAMTAMEWTATVFNIDFTGLQTDDINDNLTVAHIHGPAAPGSSTGVIWGFIGTPFNDTDPTDVVVTPFDSGVGGTVTSKWDLDEGNNTTFAAQVGNILAGLTYLNFHTVQFGSGEIRGQITVVPEPETYLLMLAGLAGVGAMVRRRRGAPTAAA